MVVEYRDDTPFTGDNHTPTELANAIRTKKNAKDVREPIAQAVEKLSNAVLGGNIGNVVATPTKVFTNLSALQSAYPNGADGVMVTVDDGHKYYWQNNSWVDFGVYQSSGVDDTSSALLNGTGEIIYNEIKGYYNSIDSSKMDEDSRLSKVTDFFRVSPGIKIMYFGISRGAAFAIEWRDKSGAIIQYSTANDTTETSHTFVAPDNAYQARAQSLGADLVNVPKLAVSLDFNSRFNIQKKFTGSVLKDAILDLSGTVNLIDYSTTVTDFIETVSGETHLYTGHATGYPAAIFYANDKKTVISKTMISGTVENHVITTPDAAEYVRFQSTAKRFKDLIDEPTLIINGHRINKDSDENYKINYHRGYLNQVLDLFDESYVSARLGLVKVTPTEQLCYKGGSRNNSIGVVWFDVAKSFLESEVLSTGTFESKNLIVPENARYAIFQSINDAGQPPTLIVEGLDRGNVNRDMLAGRTWVALGDSFTHGDFTGLSDGFTFQKGASLGLNMVYPFFIKNRNPNFNVVNLAHNGFTLAKVGSASSNVVEGEFSIIPSNVDIITIYIGINDSHQNVPIGTIDSTDETTFMGAYNSLIEKIYTNFPKVKIGIIVSNGCDTEAYPQATIQIAKKWGIPYLDLNYDDKVPLMHRTFRNVSTIVKQKRLDLFKVSNENHHPNVFAHEFESTFIEDFLKKL